MLSFLLLDGPDHSHFLLLLCGKTHNLQYSGKEETRFPAWSRWGEFVAPLHDLWVWRAWRRPCQWPHRQGISVLCWDPNLLSRPSPKPPSPLTRPVGLWRASGHCSHCFWKMGTQPCSIAELTDTAGANGAPGGGAWLELCTGVFVVTSPSHVKRSEWTVSNLWWLHIRHPWLLFCHLGFCRENWLSACPASTSLLSLCAGEQNSFLHWVDNYLCAERRFIWGGARGPEKNFFQKQRRMFGKLWLSSCVVKEVNS